MLKQIRNYILLLASTFILSTPILVTANASALVGAGANATGGGCNGNIASNISKGIGATSGTNGSNCGGPSATSSISSIAKKIIDIFSVVVGVVSVFMIVYAGFRYITSGGGGGTTDARNTLLYAVVGLIIVAIAQIIVRFVLNTANGIQ